MPQRQPHGLPQAGIDRMLATYCLLRALEEIAKDADQEELSFLAHRTANVANNLVEAASRAGQAHRNAQGEHCLVSAA